MFLIDILEEGTVPPGNKKKTSISMHISAFVFENVSRFSCVNITDEQVTELRDYCESFFCRYCLFFNVNPTIWTLGNVVPLHVEQMKATGKYGLDLGSWTWD